MDNTIVFLKNAGHQDLAHQVADLQSFIHRQISDDPGGGQESDCAKEQLQEQLINDGPPSEFYHKRKADTPFCPQCWQVDNKLITLAIPAPSIPGMGSFMCPRCDKMYSPSEDDFK